MTPYIKKIVELHKIHKAIEEKDCCNDGGGKKITIDDIVKFIHDDIEAVSPGIFPYTTWNDIPDYSDANNEEYFKSNNIDDEMVYIDEMLHLPNYFIAIKTEIV